MANLRVPQNFTGGYSASDLITHTSKSTLTLCACVYLVSNVTGAVVAITSWSSNLTSVPGYVGVTFKTTSGVAASKVEHSEGVRPANMEGDIFLIAAGVTEADILAGVWADATGTLFLANYEAVNMGQLVLIKGPISQIVQKFPLASVEFQSWSAALTKMIGTVTRPECTHDFGDVKCGVDLTPFTHTGTLTSVTSPTVFIDTSRTETSDYFQNGKITFTSGPNSGLGTFQIDAWNPTTKQFTLRRPLPYIPAVGNTYTAIRGCRKRFQADCIAKFSNAANYGSFPAIPTPEQVLKLPST